MAPLRGLPLNTTMFIGLSSPGVAGARHAAFCYYQSGWSYSIARLSLLCSNQIALRKDHACTILADWRLRNRKSGGVGALRCFVSLDWNKKSSGLQVCWVKNRANRSHWIKNRLRNEPRDNVRSYSNSVIESCTSIASRLRGVPSPPLLSESGDFRVPELNSN